MSKPKSGDLITVLGGYFFFELRKAFIFEKYAD